MPVSRIGLLQAVEEGRLSVEEVVERLSRLRGAQKAVSELVKRARQRDRRRLSVRRQAYDEALARAVLEAFERRFASRPDVLDWHWGKAIRKGEREDGVALVVRVHGKRPPSELADDERLPAWLEIEHEGTTHRIRIDVQESQHGEKQAVPLRSARGSVSVEARTGTLSALLSRPDTLTSDVLFSGHVAQQNGATASIADFSGDVVHAAAVTLCIDDTQIDGAVVRGVPNAALDTIGLEPTAARDSPSGLVDLYVQLRTLDGEVRAAFVDDVGVDVGFAGGPMSGLLRLSQCISVAGDSGAAVTDSSGKIVGFVIGRDAAATRTFLIPARRVLDAFED